MRRASLTALRAAGLASVAALAVILSTAISPAAGLDVNKLHGLNHQFLSQRPPTHESGFIHRIVGTTFRSDVHDSDEPWLVKFCNGGCFDAERGTLKALVDVSEMMQDKKSGRTGTFNYMLNDLEDDLKFYRDEAKDERGQLPPTFLLWVPGRKDREAGLKHRHYTGTVSKESMVELLEALNVPLGRTIKERKRAKDEL